MTTRWSISIAPSSVAVLDLGIFFYLRAGGGAANLWSLRPMTAGETFLHVRKMECSQHGGFWRKR